MLEDLLLNASYYTLLTILPSHIIFLADDGSNNSFKHWVEKNCFPWAKDYLRDQLVGVSLEADGINVEVTGVTSVTGDADINQRKGKLITVYDVAFTLTWKGKNAAGTEASGKITIPEMMHDTDLDDLTMEVSLDDETNEKRTIKEVVRTKLSKKIQDKLQNFSKDMITANSKDVHIPAEEMKGHPVTQTYKPKPPAPSETAAKASAGSKVVGGTTTLNMDVEFVCSAADLFETFLNAGRVQVWSRGPAQIEAVVGGSFALFGGNVTGKILELEQHKKIVQTWRLKSWPEGHFSTVTIEFEEQRESVKLRLKQTQVPIGDLEITRKNWEGYYWNGIKSAFGQMRAAARSQGGVSKGGSVGWDTKREDSDSVGGSRIKSKTKSKKSKTNGNDGAMNFAVVGPVTVVCLAAVVAAWVWASSVV
ncbi:hypothetical protein HDU76_000161 [Blyttiomyces sp. JEL0837]|nr:hypothetical protein HDU76_000161 [Blyttiomyces sp. JEL0837]